MSELTIQQMQAIEIEGDQLWKDTLRRLKHDEDVAGRALAVKILILERNLEETQAKLTAVRYASI